MDDIFKLTQEEITKIERDTRIHVSTLYQNMLSGDRDAERQLGKICDGALVYHRYNCLSPIDEVYAKHDLNFVADHYDDWILEAIDNQKSSEEFERQWNIDNGGGLEYVRAVNREDHVGSYIDEALAMGEDDLDYDEDFTAASVCRM